MIRRATSKDEFILLDMQTQCLPGDDPLDPSTGRWWVCLEDGEPAGFASMHPSRQWYDTQYLSRAGVLPGFRGRGLQRALIRVRLRAARQIGATWAISDTSDNAASANNLIACGFRVLAPSQPWGLSTSTYWKRRL